MWRRLKAVLEWIVGHQAPSIQLSLHSPYHEGLSQGWRQRPDSRPGPGDFESRLKEPKWRGPTGRSGSVAVPEPDDEERFLLAIGRSK